MEIFYIKSDENYKVIEKQGAKITETRLNTDKVEVFKLHKITLEIYLKTMKLVQRKEIIDFIIKNKLPYRLPEVQLKMDLQQKLF